MSFSSFQDPLLNGFSKIQIRKRKTEDRSLMMKIADTVMKTRLQSSGNQTFSQKADVVLESVFKLLIRERYHFVWNKFFLIGCSAGGDVAMRTLFKYVIVPHLPIVIVMHHNPGFKFMTKFQMANSTTQYANLGTNNTAILGSKMYFIPGERTINFNRSPKSFQIMSNRQRTRFRPDINAVFTAAAARYKENLIGVILSGMLYDGAEGAKAVALNKGELLVQEPASALFKDMPKAAIKTVPSAKICSIKAIADRINQLSRETMSIQPIGLF